MFEVRYLGSNFRLYIWIENIFKNYNFLIGNVIVFFKELRFDIENLDGRVLQNRSMDFKDFSFREKKEEYIIILVC